MHVGIRGAEGGLVKEARGVLRTDEESGRRALHLGDEIGRGGGTGAGIEHLEVEVAGLREAEGRGQLSAAVKGGGDRGSVLKDLRAGDEVQTLHDDGRLADVEGHRRGRGQDRDGVQDGDVLREGDRWIIDADHGELYDIAGRGNHGGRGVGDGAVGIGDSRSDLRVTAGNAVDEEIDGRIGGAGDLEADVELVAHADVGPLLGLELEDDLAGANDDGEGGRVGGTGIGIADQQRIGSGIGRGDRRDQLRSRDEGGCNGRSVPEDLGTVDELRSADGDGGRSF